jgi:uncharacterized membrane protein
VTWTDTAALTHVAAATSGLVLGAVVLIRGKGTPSHRVIGGVYAGVLLLVNVAALSVHRDATFGVFHWLALVSLVTLVVGLAPLLLGRRSGPAVATHAYCMTWSYAGLVAAGTGQLAASRGTGGSVSVPATIGVVLLACAAAIAWRVPPAVRAVGGQSPTA